VYLDLGKTARQRQSAYRAQFRTALDRDALDAIRLALNQNQPLGSARFLTRIARVTGERREARPRGRPRLEAAQGL
jgi:putative transposase